MTTFIPFIPDRPEKPRSKRLTMVMDKGLSIRQAEDFMSVGSLYTDYVKLGFGTAVLTPGYIEKIELYKHAGVIPYFGGTMFEVFAVRNMFDEYSDFAERSGLTLVEVSDGSYEMDRKVKLNAIEKLSRKFTVISEVGSKKKDVVFTPQQWVSMMKEELQAGSVKVIAEARESGTIGIYNDDGSVNNELIERISEEVGTDNVLWEAPEKSQQAWFIKHFGADVNLGNIAPSEIIPLETLRCGLRGDTFFQFLPPGLIK
ncbi:MAG: phosphosulfolactate synthase [Bacteroidales bacterium]|nr:phosphosulfolactate synthase [Bacteroidales bacterium]